LVLGAARTLAERFEQLFELIQYRTSLIQEPVVRTTVSINDDLYDKALEVADPAMHKADLFREAFKTFVRVRAATRLAALGGAVPDMLPRPDGVPSPRHEWRLD
jgi:hypothetical protein